MSDHARLKQVIDGGYCVGCGGCAALDSRIKLGFDTMQRLQARLPEDPVATGTANACPFADGTPNEDEISDALFAGPDIRKDSRIGPHLATFGGWVTEGDYRARASSGGIGSWLQAELLEKGLVDAVIDVCEVDAGPGQAPLFRFTVAHSVTEIRDNAKTRYYPVEMSEVLQYVRDTPGHYALIGVPCFAKSARLVARQDPVIAERLAFVLAIVCGHLKSTAFAESIAWQAGVHPDTLTGIDFRAKLQDRPASSYGATVTSVQDGQRTSVTRPMEGLLGANWGHGLFKLKGCEFCDDVLGETADGVVGDAWLPGYVDDPKGANIVVARHPVLRDLLIAGRAEGRLHLDTISADEVAASQAGGLRHRREGLAYRLWLTDKAQKWRPQKRVAPRRDHLDPHMRKVHRLRYEIGQSSHAHFADARRKNSLNAFLSGISPELKKYDRLMNPTILRRALNLLHRKLISVSKRMRTD